MSSNKSWNRAIRRLLGEPLVWFPKQARYEHKLYVKDLVSASSAGEDQTLTVEGLCGLCGAPLEAGCPPQIDEESGKLSIRYRSCRKCLKNAIDEAYKAGGAAFGIGEKQLPGVPATLMEARK